ncbi:hypothetical protein TPHA_0B00640 [Tetrapisispora phaffii CBS 4417]|uniref:Protein HYM1 n=1 Tax=Tetrapisispora phaffii (strain ATCC 24235 / CBS 4417 / NBRC 1672 / NRRL Y-8282 / UCD 70-5) TaxID=1071381 RepID=G8BQD9_TETPH|nr:hypothetical protein TPHA_0B00640 [Tetrapisispora phaffii CBS 4417]CCE61736.1 hypothetical protein TPHA_0B00640 [Tetrapisispora phaffii CBS 4417]
MFKKHKNQDLDMSFLWKKNPKPPNEYVKYSLELTSKLPGTTTLDNKKKLQDDLLKYLTEIKEILISKDDLELTNALHLEINKMNFFIVLINNLHELNLDIMKELNTIFTVALNYSIDNKLVTVDYFVLHPKTVQLLLVKIESILQQKTKYSNSTNSRNDMFSITGKMILECTKYEQLCRIILIKDTNFWKFFSFAKMNNFEISSLSFQILISLFTTNEKLVSKEFFNIESNSNKFIINMNKLIAHGNYVTKRQSLKLLHDLIIVKSNNIMMSYINSPENMKLIMTVMTDKSKLLQLDAFNIFKIFVANPRKTKPILDILIKNRDKLLLYLNNFADDSFDRMFKDEKEFIIQEIESLPRLFSSTTDSIASTTPPTHKNSMSNGSLNSTANIVHTGASMNPHKIIGSPSSNSLSRTYQDSISH